MKAYDLKKYLSDNPDKIEELLEEIGMHHITRHGSYFTCGMPDGDNPNSTSIYIDTLKVNAYTRCLGTNPDIFMLVMFVKNISFVDSVILIHELFNLEFGYVCDNSEDTDLLSKFRRITRPKNEDYTYKTYSKEILEEYYDFPHVDFIKDNILPKTWRKFGVRFDFESQRILISHFYWSTGELIGMFGRTTIPNYKELNINKYIGVLPFSKSGNLYGLHLNYPEIKKHGYVVVVESEKSVMQADSFGENCICALGCKSMSKEQRAILLSLDVDIIIGLDKDVSLTEVKHMCSMFEGKRNVFYLNDTNNLLKEKDSPTDNGAIIYNFLLDDKIKYKGE